VPFELKWLPERVGLRNTDPINSTTYKDKILQKSTIKKVLKDNKAHEVNKPKKHIIHKAIEWKRMLDARSVRSYGEIARKEGRTRARVTQIMNLLKLPPEWKTFLAGLDDPKDIPKYSERRLRNYRQSNFPDKPPQIKKKPTPDPKEKSSEKTRTKKKQPPRVIAVEIDEHLSPLSLEALKELIRKAALRKLKELEKDT
jgi:hypothetical protein